MSENPVVVVGITRGARRFGVAFVVLALAVIGLGPALFAASEKEQRRAAADAFFTNHHFVCLSLEIPEEGMESLRKAPREYVPATLREGNIVYSNIAVHLKGGAGSFRKVDDRPGLTLDFNRYTPGLRFHGLKKIHLNNAAQDPTRLSEFIGGQLFREAGVPAARCSHTLLELNGRQLGLYVAMESMDSYFLSRYFEDNNGNLYGQTRSCDVTDAIERMEGDAPLTYDDLKALAAAVQEEDPARRLVAMEKTLDIERFLSFMAMEVILTHHDGYTFNRHNYRIYQDLDTGRMVFFPHDLDQLMKRPSQGLMPAGRGLVAQAVMNTPELRTRYQERVTFLATNLLVVPRLLSRVDAAVAALTPAIARHDAEIAAAFTNTAAEFKMRIQNRGALLQRQMDIVAGRLSPLVFRNDIARLTDWRPQGTRGLVSLKKVKTEDRRPALWLKLEGTNTAIGTWGTQVLLDPGWYRFEGQVRCAGVDSFRRRRDLGAGLVAPASRGRVPYRLVGDLTWQTLGFEFEVTARDDVELVCELRADQGEAWFAEDSLQLVRLAEGPPVSGMSREFVNKAMESVRAAAREAALDKNRPVFHFRPPAQWMNDVCGVVYYQRRYHVFFQFNPWADTWGDGIGWGHAASRDLVRWTFMSPALLPDAQTGSILDGSGSAAIDGYGRPMLFYTHTPAGYPKNKREQWAAIPEDENLLNWRRVNIGLAPGKNGVPSSIAPSWGDMFVFKAGDRAFATFKDSKGLVCEAQNPGLTLWKAAGKIPDLTGECPNLFLLQDRHVLIQSGYPTSYRVGTFDPKQATFQSDEKQARVLDYGAVAKDAPEGRGLYGTTVFTDAKDRTILLGWIGGFPPGRHWNGVMSLPRILRLEGGQLLQEPIPELAMLRGRRTVTKAGRWTNPNRILDGLRSNALEAVVEIEPGTATAFGVRLRGPEAGQEGISIRYSAGVLNVAGREVPCPLPGGGAFKLRLFFDKSVLEVFANDGRIAVTKVVPSPATDLRLELFSEGGDVKVRQFEAWPMHPAL